MTAGALLARALDALYTVSPAEFTSTRKELAAQAKTAGDAAAAKAIAGAKKPTQVAYLLNQLARAEGERVAELVDLGRTLERAQRTALRSGDAAELRTAIAAQRKAIATLVTKAAALARSLSVHVAMHAVTGALQAAVTDAAVGAELEAGLLQTAPEVRGGFGGGFALETATPRAAAVPAAKKAEPVAKAAKSSAAAGKAEAKQAAREAAAAAKRRAAEQKAQAAAERKAAADTKRAAAQVAREVTRLERVATKAEAEASRLEAAAKQAFEAAEAARSEATLRRTEALKAKRGAKAAR